MSFRRPQTELIELLKKVQAQVVTLPHTIIAECIPGGGKSALVPILAYFLLRILRLVDRIVWVVPNGSLRHQGAEEFIYRGEKASWISKAIGLDFEIVENDNRKPMDKGTHGYITTAHAILADADTHQQYFRQHRCLLIIDESHHYRIGKPITEAIKPLSLLAVCTAYLTGFLSRRDCAKVFGVPYVQKEDGLHVDRRCTSEVHWIRYGLRDALKEQAIIQTRFFKVDGAAAWEEMDGSINKVASLEQGGAGLFTALSTGYACDLMTKCYKHWQKYLFKHPKAKILVVCANVSQARMIKDFVLHTLKESRVDIATYKDDKPNKTIEAFRNANAIKILITVAKAYEGMDCKSITHLAILTHIRSTGWIMQNLGRGWRHDPDCPLPWNQQRSHVWIPDDAKMRAILRWIEEEQEPFVIDLNDGPDDPRKRRLDDDEEEERERIIPIESVATLERTGAFGEIDLSPRITAYYQHLIDQSGALCDPSDLRSILLTMGIPIPDVPDSFQPIEPTLKTTGQTMMSDEPPDGLTPGKRIEWLKSRLNSLVKSGCGGDAEKITKLNGKLVYEFGERSSLSEAQLKRAIQWIRNRFLLHGETA